jgi:hypothetical protein
VTAVAKPIELYRDQFAVYLHDVDLRAIEQRWSSATKGMSEQQFRDGVSRLAEFLSRERVPNALVDVTDMGYKAAPEFEPWRQLNIIPKYNAAGVLKFAFLLPAGATDTVENGTKPAKEGVAEFPTGYFGSREGIRKWFDSGSV